jgi:hypothetical protein
VFDGVYFVTIVTIYVAFFIVIVVHNGMENINVIICFIATVIACDTLIPVHADISKIFFPFRE